MKRRPNGTAAKAAMDTLRRATAPVNPAPPGEVDGVLCAKCGRPRESMNHAVETRPRAHDFEPPTAGVKVRVYCHCTHSDLGHHGAKGDGYCVICKSLGLPSCAAFSAKGVADAA